VIHTKDYKKDLLKDYRKDYPKEEERRDYPRATGETSSDIFLLKEEDQGHPHINTVVEPNVEEKKQIPEALQKILKKYGSNRTQEPQSTHVEERKEEPQRTTKGFPVFSGPTKEAQDMVVEQDSIDPLVDMEYEEEDAYGEPDECGDNPNITTNPTGYTTGDRDSNGKLIDPPTSWYRWGMGF
jgi:hypothetical protein